MKNKEIISLFTGAGGLDLGFKNAGFKTVWANEYDKKIVPTYKKNFVDVYIETNDIRNIISSKIPKVNGIIGGPPCQSFSEAGAGRGTKDPRGQLFWDYIRILEDIKPMFFVAENVSGLLSKKHRKDLDLFLESFNNAGYEVTYQLYNSSDYLVPQDRERLIMVGFRKDLGKKFIPPDIETKKIPMKDSLSNLKDAIGTKNGTTNPLAKNNNEYMTGSFSSMFMSRNRVRGWEEQSFTILATARQIPIHPSAPKMVKIEKDKYTFVEAEIDKYRRLSVRECARLQTFPDSFELIYERIEDGYKMVGNAVPVKLAEAIARSIDKQLFN